MMKSMVTTAGLGMAGDAIAQLGGRRLKVKELERAGKDASHVPHWDMKRFFKMATFGFFYYGPLQGLWYPFLNSALPVNNALSVARKFPNFAGKVLLNQLVLGPAVVSVVFAYTMLLDGKPELIASKISKDMLPTLQTGWKFWIPASMINFTVVPLHHQVLYMSTCGVVWNAILSAASG